MDISNDELAKKWLETDKELRKHKDLMTITPIVDLRESLLIEIEKRMTKENFDEFLMSENPEVLYNGLKDKDKQDSNLYGIFSQLNT